MALLLHFVCVLALRRDSETTAGGRFIVVEPKMSKASRAAPIDVWGRYSKKRMCNEGSPVHVILNDRSG